MAYIKLNRENFYHNICQIANKTGSLEKIAIVLKDNAYGHGLLEMAEMASDFGIRHAVVRDEREAKEVVTLFDSTMTRYTPPYTFIPSLELTIFLNKPSISPVITIGIKLLRIFDHVLNSLYLICL